MEDLISKKELLEKTGISYGQLYRWKRKNILPEEWFIKKSSYTGQETFFPREKVLKRIEKVVSLKDTYSLDDLADMFSPNSSSIKLDMNELDITNYFSPMAIELAECYDSSLLKTTDILKLVVLDTIREQIDMTLVLGKSIVHLLEDYMNRSLKNSYALYIIQKNEEYVIIGAEENTPLFIDETSEIVEIVSLQNCSDRVSEIIRKIQV